MIGWWFIFVQSFMKIFLTVLKLQSGHNFRMKNFKKHNSIKMVWFLFSAHRLMVVFICSKSHANILDGIKVIEQIQFSYEKFQRSKIP